MTIADSATEQALLPVTPSVIEGPYFRIGAPQRESLVEPGITGERMVLTGRVLNRAGKPIPRAVLQFWMSDDAGNYDMVGYQLHGYTFALSDESFSAAQEIVRKALEELANRELGAGGR